MKLQLLFVMLFAFFIFYDGYLKGPLQQLYSYGQIITGGLVIAYLIYSYIKNPSDIYGALDFAQNYLLHNNNTKTTFKQAFEGKKDRSVSQLLKKKVAANQKWQCGHCNTILDASYEVDHILALYKGGSNEEDNLVALCRNCHGKKTVAERLFS